MEDQIKGRAISVHAFGTLIFQSFFCEQCLEHVLVTSIEDFFLPLEDHLKEHKIDSEYEEFCNYFGE